MSDVIPPTEQMPSQEESRPEIALDKFVKSNEALALAEQIFSIFDEVVQDTCRTDQDQPVIWAVGIISSTNDPLSVRSQTKWINGLTGQRTTYKSNLEFSGLMLTSGPESEKPVNGGRRLDGQIARKYGPVATSLHFDLEEKHKNIEKGQAPKTLTAVSGLGVNNIVIDAWFGFILELAKDNSVSEPMEDAKVGEIRDFIKKGIEEDVAAIEAIREELYPGTTTKNLSNDQISVIHGLMETSYLTNTVTQEQSEK